MNYDIVGDVHGHHGKLISLLKKLGYQERAGAYRHPTRQAIFVGDFIDRGEHQVKTLNTVRRMVESGAALAVMGNHEFNAIAWYTEDPHSPGQHLRPRHGPKGSKNRDQHKAFLKELEHDAAAHRAVIDWFYTLPLWLDLPGLRIVHACWHDSYMATLKPKLTADQRLTPELVVLASRKSRVEYTAAETILKGVELRLPDGRTFKDKDGNIRDHVRVRWWDAGATTFRAAAITGGKEYQDLPDDPIPPEARPGYSSDTPVFFGHYWMVGKPSVQSPLAACVDYSAGHGGPLVAYRWEGEPTLDDSHFLSSATE